MSDAVSAVDSNDPSQCFEANRYPKVGEIDWNNYNIYDQSGEG